MVLWLLYLIIFDVNGNVMGLIFVWVLVGCVFDIVRGCNYFWWYVWFCFGFCIIDKLNFFVICDNCRNFVFYKFLCNRYSMINLMYKFYIIYINLLIFLVYIVNFVNFWNNKFIIVVLCVVGFGVWLIKSCGRFKVIFKSYIILYLLFCKVFLVVLG